MRRSLAILAAASFMIGTAQARIGDTEEQIRTGYGNPITVLPSRASDPGLTKCYSSDGFSIAVTYLNGHSVREMFVKSDNSKITKTEIDRLINGHASASSKEVQHMVGPESVTASVQVWRSADQRSRVAIYDSRTRGLFITTQQFIDLTNAKNRQITARANLPLLGSSGLPKETCNFSTRATRQCSGRSTEAVCQPCEVKVGAPRERETQRAPEESEPRVFRARSLLGDLASLRRHAPAQALRNRLDGRCAIVYEPRDV